MSAFTFIEILKKLEEFWAAYGCTILLPYNMELGAATLHPATIIGSISSSPSKIAYVQPVIRPSDGRYGVNPNRLYQHHQYQVLLKPSPDNLQDLYLKSLEYIGINIYEHDIRFVEDDWENPSVGAWGLGWEVWCDGMEISQFTYMQQVGGIECQMIPGELAYGLERIAMYIQNVQSVYDIIYNKDSNEVGHKEIKYSEIFRRSEYEFSAAALDIYDKDLLLAQFKNYEKLALIFLERSLPLVAYNNCLGLSHTLNLLDSRGFISVNERAKYILLIRGMVKSCCQIFIQENIQENSHENIQENSSKENLEGKSYA